MALKEERLVLETDISCNCSTTASQGEGLCYSTSGSGVSQGDSAGIVLKATNPSGLVFAGPVLNEFVNVDETVYFLNRHKDQMNINEPATVLRKGYITTNSISGTPTKGATAYLIASGLFSPTVDAAGGVAQSPKAGQFGGIKDADGYVKIEFNLPLI